MHKTQPQKKAGKLEQGINPSRREGLEGAHRSSGSSGMRVGMSCCAGSGGLEQGWEGLALFNQKMRGWKELSDFPPGVRAEMPGERGD